MPGIVHEFEDPPPHLKAAWDADREFWTFHSPKWWGRHWAKTGLADVVTADMVPDGWLLWADSDQASLELGLVPDASAGRAVRWIETIREVAGGTLGFTRMVARRGTRTA